MLSCWYCCCYYYYTRYPENKREREREREDEIYIYTIAFVTYTYIQRSMFYQILLFIGFLFIHSSSSYHFESCCLNDKQNTTRLLSCPLNFVIKLRSVHFHTGNGCSTSTCQKRLNKHYLQCNNHRTCSISIQCIHMDISTCSWLTNATSYSQYIVVDYDCIVYPIANKPHEENLVLFSAKIDIETPITINDTTYLDDEYEWKEYFLKKYLQEKKIFAFEQKNSLFSDIIRTVIILICFALILISLMFCSLWFYKRKICRKEKHQPFPIDEAYDNLKTTSDSGSTTDV